MSAADGEVLRRPAIIERIAAQHEDLFPLAMVAYFFQAQLARQDLADSSGIRDCYEKFLARHPDLEEKTVTIDGEEVAVLGAIRSSLITANLRPSEGVNYRDLPRAELCHESSESG